jgi:hypothetical protein
LLHFMMDSGTLRQRALFDPVNQRGLGKIGFPVTGKAKWYT